MSADTIRCIGPIGGGCCSRAVRPEGGAWCEAHRPVDLTRGVAPWDRPAPLGSRGQTLMARSQRDGLDAALRAAGWQRCELDGRELWRDPSTGELVTRETASARDRGSRSPVRRVAGPLGRARTVDEATVQGWADRLDAGERYSTIAAEAGVTPRLVHMRVREARLAAERAA